MDTNHDPGKRIRSGLLTIGICVVALSLSGSVAGAPQPLAELEPQMAKRAGCEPNPAVMKMSPAEYAAALGRLHPALTIGAPDAVRMFEWGKAQKKKDAEEFSKPWRFTIGSGRDRVYLWPGTRELGFMGWETAREYKPDPTDLAQHYALTNHYLRVIVDMSREGSAADLKSSRFVLLTEDEKHYQTSSSGLVGDIQSRTYYDAYTTSRRLGNTIVHTTDVDAMDVHSGAYRAFFDLLNPDGTPRITPDHRSFTIVRITARNEKRVKIDLAKLTVATLTKAR